ncbi:MAG: hypothetical protein ACHRHE_05630 [Tepidisphaerales bacterium]
MNAMFAPTTFGCRVERLESRCLLSGGAAMAAAHMDDEHSPAVEMAEGHEAHGPLLPQLSVTPTLNPSTVPANGDVNPYGVAFVPRGFARGGMLNPGDILVSNFNNSANLQGTGTTITRVTPDGHASLFFQGPVGLGLTTALGVLRGGFVIVGNVPTTDGTSATIQPGSLLVLDRNGVQVASFQDADLLNGPWDLTVNDEGSHAQVFVSNVLSGTVTRLDLRIHNDTVSVTGMTQIASRYAHRPDPAALEIGPTGLALDAERGILYVASTGDNAVYAIKNALRRPTDAGQGSLIYQDNNHLRGPLGLVLAPNGDLITTNGDAVNPDPTQVSEMVEFTTRGQFVAQQSVDASGAGGAFGIALARSGDKIVFAAVDDVNNTLEVWNLKM